MQRPSTVQLYVAYTAAHWPLQLFLRVPSLPTDAHGQLAVSASTRTTAENGTSTLWPSGCMVDKWAALSDPRSSPAL